MQFAINVWCAIYDNKIIDPVFYDGTLMGTQYLQLLQNVILDFAEKLSLFNLRNLRFQHNGALVYKTFPVKRYFVKKQIIGYGGFEDWPPHSSDLTPLDFFLWGYLKQQVYATPPQILQDLKRRIVDAYTNVTCFILHSVQHEIKTRIQICIATDCQMFEYLK